VLQNMPGMARAPLLSGALLVRGAQPQDTEVLIDGVPIPLLYHLGGGPSVLSPSYIDKIDFYPGAYGAKYGRAIAGIVDIETGAPAPTALHGEASVDLLNAGFFLETPLSREKNFGTLSVAARHSVIDFLLPPILKLTTRPGQTSIVATPAYWDYQARYDLTLDGNAFELSAYGSNDALAVSQAGTTTTQAFSLNTDQGFHRFRARWSRKTDDGWSFYAAPTLGLTVNTADLNDTTKITSNSTDFNLRGWAKKELNRALSFELGVDVNASWFHNRFEIAGLATAADENPAPSVHDQHLALVTYAGYVEMVYSPIERWKWIPGLRLELYNLPSGLLPSFEPRLATRFRLTDWLTAKAAWGIYRQAPQSRQLDSALGNADLGLAMSQQSAGGFEFQIIPKLSLDVQGFYNWRTGLVTGSSTLVTKNGVTQPERFNNSGTGRAYGLEVLFKQDLTERFYGWIAYTLSRSESYELKADTWSPVNTDQTHIFTLVASYKFDFGLEAGVRFRLTTGSPYTPVLGSTFNADSGNYGSVNGPTNSARAATFNQLDVRLEKQFTFSLWKFSIYLDVQNVYNAPNAEQILYDYRYAQTAAINGLPLIPSLGVKGEF
jgi:outer membrane receptor for ferrienterochelin and colicin